MFSELELYRAKRIIREMAKANGVSEDEIRAEMNKAIEAGMSDPAPTAQAAWKASPFNGSKPSPEEFILWCASQIDHQD